MKRGWSGGKIAAVIAGGFAAVIILIVAFVASVFHLSEVLAAISEGDYEEAFLWEFEDEDSDEDEEDSDDTEDSDEEKDRDSDRKKRRSKKDSDEDSDDDSDNESDEDSDNEWDEVFDFYEDEYYEFGNAITEGLSYEISFENFERNDFVEDEEGNFLMVCKYPVVTGEVPNIEGINREIIKEIEYVEEHVEQVAEYLGGGDYEYQVNSYVTYMSEDVLSIAYEEYAYLEGDFFESYIVSVNFDMETGMILKNTQLLDVNDAFSIEFRKRCEKQNGEIEDISYMSDQEITEYLTDEESLIVFYTPIGIEVGFNYYDGWVTVTYSDYQKYQQF